MMNGRLFLGAILAVAIVAPVSVRAQNTPVTAPTPAPMPTISGTPIPYPAYGSPAPDEAAQQPHPGVPVTITLTQAIDIAAAQSPTFASERAVYREIAAKYGAEQGAFFPNIGVDASVTKNYGSATTLGSTGSGGTGSTPAPIGLVQTTEEAKATLTQLIYDGGRTIAGLRSAKESTIAGKNTLIRDLQTLAFNVATAYVNVLQAQATVQSDNALVREFELQEQLVQAQIRTGAAARSDLAAAQFQTAQARGNLVTAQGTLIADQSTFATALGLDADTEVNPQPLNASQLSKTSTYKDALTQALQFRPDYIAALHTVESDKENLRYAKLARFPLLEGNASDGYSRTLYSGSGGGGLGFGSNKSLGATLTFPIYDQGITNYNVAVAASQLDQDTASLTNTKLTVQSQVRSALATLFSAQANLVQAQAELQSGTVNLQATQAQYKVGATTITALVTAEATLATAQASYISALYNERLQEQNYIYALGTNDLKL
jgi:outer membrane protein TolC